NNICYVLEPVMKCKEISQVIVVSDGSTDRTAEVAREMGAEVITLPSNRGKGAAVMAGVQASTAEVILLLDADLMGLTPHHISDLISPIINQDAIMTIGFFTAGRISTDLSQQVTPFLNGQRAVRRELFESLPNLDHTKYGIEVVLSRFARVHQCKVVWVNLPNLSQVMKEEKMGFYRGFIARLRMYWQIIKVLVSTKIS
ncbi:MAG TPA: glycosyl transferase family 2, partial [Firmicutes bacterium]|nr:glycosyl transferase family 2 [Bacillota bacterium]